MQRIRCAVAIAVCLALLGVGIPWALADGCEGCDCDEQWWTLNNPDHDGCQAGDIHAGSVSPEKNEVFRWHDLDFTKTRDTDTDCHCTEDCDYEDVSETEFTCTWTLQELVGTEWQTAATGSLSGTSCTGATFVGTRHCEPGGTYRTVVEIDDTPGDGPSGDDAPDYRYSTTVTILAPMIRNFRQAAGFPYMDSQTDEVFEKYEWDPTCRDDIEGTNYCTNDGHLDKITVREYVTFEDNPLWTVKGIHRVWHGGRNYWESTWAKQDPYISSVCGEIGEMGDRHSKPGARTEGEPNASLCEADQVYSYKTGWEGTPPGPPANDWEPGTGTLLGSYKFQRIIEEKQGGGWQYRWTKGSWSLTNGRL